MLDGAISESRERRSEVNAVERETLSTVRAATARPGAVESSRGRLTGGGGGGFRWLGQRNGPCRHGRRGPMRRFKRLGSGFVAACGSRLGRRALTTAIAFGAIAVVSGQVTFISKANHKCVPAGGAVLCFCENWACSNNGQPCVVCDDPRFEQICVEHTGEICLERVAGSTSPAISCGNALRGNCTGGKCSSFQPPVHMGTCERAWCTVGP